MEEGLRLGDFDFRPSALRITANQEGESIAWRPAALVRGSGLKGLGFRVYKGL